ncbi:MAG: glycogen branching protein, partial [Candidatus Entotheonella gemina]
NLDPFGFYHEIPPKSASLVWDLTYTWNDGDWMQQRARHNAFDAPMSIYEVHPGSWQRTEQAEGAPLTYRQLTLRLADYVQHMGFTHVEFLPVMEHPFYGSWGYQTTGYFAPTSRYGTPQDFMYLIDLLHQHGIGVILDWVPSHFPGDEHGLGYFDGSHLYEHADPRLGFHPDWKSFIFNYGRNEVRSFLLSSALFWLDYYHADGLRVDAVASMLYLDYSRAEGDWLPNLQGGRENPEAIAFLRHLNKAVHHHYPDIKTFAEESTDWPMVSRPIDTGGLGFDFKWDMGWMHDTLTYMQRDPIHRCYHHNDLTFRQLYAFSENFTLPLSHDEVVHGKGSLLHKMPGDDWQKFANLRLLLGYMYAQPGKKLLFMGSEFGQWSEWYHERGLNWYLTEHDGHAGLQHWVRDLNILYRETPALYVRDCHADGFQWVNCHDAASSVLSFLRLGPTPMECVLVVLNFTPVPRSNYLVGVPIPGTWEVVGNSDAVCYGGSEAGHTGAMCTNPIPSHGHFQTLTLTLPPLGVMFLKPATS